MVKPVIAVLSLVVGAGAAGALVEFSTHPDLFITTPAAPAAPLAEFATPPAAAALDAIALTDVPAPSRIVLIKEVTVYGQVPMVRHVTHPFLVKRRATPPSVPVVAANTDPAAPRVVAPPCVDGQYRQIDEHRGVRLMCFGPKPDGDNASAKTE